MSAAWGIALVTIFACCYAAGVALGFRTRKTVTWAAAGCLGVILVKVLFRHYPSLEFALAPCDTYVPLRPWWPFPFTFVMLGIGLKQMTSRTGRTVVTTFAMCLFVLVGQRIALTVLFDPEVCRGRVGQDSVCRQTTGFTCGAAAAATFLAQHGVEATEGEMAVLCGTNALTGTDEFGVCRGLKRKLGDAGPEISLLKADWDGLKEGPYPAMATIRHSFLVDHWVVVLGIRETGVEVVDPLRGKTVVTRNRFLRDWRGVLVR
jgi:hypothetical protein